MNQPVITKIVVKGKRSQSDSYNEPSLSCFIYFKNHDSLYVNMSGKTVYHLQYYYPTVEIVFEGE